MNLWLIAALAFAILLLAVVPGLYFWWPSRGEPASRSDLGVALMTGALIALGVLALQVVLDVRLQKVEDDRQVAQEEQALKLQLALQSRLVGVPLQEKKLNGIYLYEKNLRNANLRQSDLSGAVLTRSDLTNAKLQKATLVGADLNGTTLVDAKLQDANMENAILSDAPMTGAELRNARLRNAVLTKAKLRWAVLAGAHLEKASLSEADLRGVDFTGAQFDRDTELDRAKYDRFTTWPARHKQRTCPAPKVCEVRLSPNPR
jgi:uncharacterized protein YjbI with pentapeptide repeats